MLVVPFAVALPWMCVQESASPLNLDAAVAETLRSHPRVAGLRRELAARLQAVKGARALTAPTVTFTPGLTSLSGTTEEVLALQPLEINGTRSARANVALAEYRLAREEARAAVLELSYEVRLALLALDQARARRKLAETQATEAKTLERLAGRQVELGTRPGIEREQLALETLRTENLKTQAASRVKSAEHALNLLLGRPADSPLPELAPIALPQETEREPVEAALASALSLRSELKQAVAEREGIEAQLKLAQAGGKPDLAPMVRVGSLLRGIPAGNTGNGAGVGISLSLPIDHGARRAQKSALLERLEGQKSRREDVARQIEREVREAWEKLAAAREVLTRYEGEALPRSERLLRASQIGFEEGKTSVLAVIEAQRTQRQLQSDTLQARTDVLLAVAALDKARGVSLTALPEVSL